MAPAVREAPRPEPTARRRRDPCGQWHRVPGRFPVGRRRRVRCVPCRPPPEPVLRPGVRRVRRGTDRRRPGRGTPHPRPAGPDPRAQAGAHCRPRRPQHRPQASGSPTAVSPPADRAARDRSRIGRLRRPPGSSPPRASPSGARSCRRARCRCRTGRRQVRCAAPGRSRRPARARSAYPTPGQPPGRGTRSSSTTKTTKTGRRPSSAAQPPGAVVRPARRAATPSRPSSTVRRPTSTSADGRAARSRRTRPAVPGPATGPRRSWTSRRCGAATAPPPISTSRGGPRVAAARRPTSTSRAGVATARRRTSTSRASTSPAGPAREALQHPSTPPAGGPPSCARASVPVRAAGRRLRPSPSRRAQRPRPRRGCARSPATSSTFPPS